MLTGKQGSYASLDLNSGIGNAPTTRKKCTSTYEALQKGYFGAKAFLICVPCSRDLEKCTRFTSLALEMHGIMWLIDTLSILPASVVGTQVFGFLSLAALGRLDAAVAHKEYRHVVLEAFSFVRTVVFAPSPFASGSARQEKQIWRWCVNRAVTIDEFQFTAVKADQEVLRLLEKVLLRVPQNGAVLYKFHRTTKFEDYFRVLCNDMIRSRITSLDVRMFYLSRWEWEWDDMHNVKALTVNGEDVAPTGDDLSLSEQALQELLVDLPALEKVVINSTFLLTLETVQALCMHGASLTHVTFGNTICHPELLNMVGQHCQNLTELKVVHIHPHLQKPLWSFEQGWIAVAQGCRKLASVTISFGACLPESVCLAFARYCPELELFSHSAPITDAVLLAFAADCPKLRTFACDTWAIESVDTVDSARSLLSRLESFDLDCCTDMPVAVLARVVSYLRSTNAVTLRGLSPAQISALGAVAFTLEKCDTLVLSGRFTAGESAVMDDLVVALAAGSPQLRTLELKRATSISGPALVRVAAVTPNMQYVKCGECFFTDLSQAESALVTVVSSWPQLKDVNMSNNWSFTDTVVRAMARSCPRLDILALGLNRSVTLAALLEAVNMLPNCKFCEPGTFNAADRDLLRQAVARVKAEAQRLLESRLPAPIRCEPKVASSGPSKRRSKKTG
jgi:hypothetical protein